VPAREVGTPPSDSASRPPPRPPRSQGATQPSEPQELSSASGRWGDFRRLCHYYAECVRLDERPHISAWQHDIGASWAPLASSMNWRALSDHRPVTAAATEELAGVLRRHRGRKGIGSFAVGLAIDLFDSRRSRDSGEPLRGLVPILYVRVWASREDDRLVLHPVGGPELNHQWLEQKFRNRDKRRELLDALELLPAPPSCDDDEDKDGGEPLLVPSIDHCLDRLFNQTSRMWVEPGNVSALRTDPPLDSVDRFGIYNRVILTALPPLKYAKRLRDELLHIAEEATDEDLDQTALRAIFPAEAKGAVAADRGGESIAEPELLNGDQRAAACAALAEELTVVTGPPGTGKSTVVQTVLVNQAIRNRPALFASKNHQGLEAVEPKLNALTEPDRLMMRPVYPFGSAERRFDWQRVMVQLLSRPSRPNIIKDRADAVKSLDSLLQEQANEEDRVVRALDLRDELGQASELAQEQRDGLPSAISDVVADHLRELPLPALARLSSLLRWIDKGPLSWMLRPAVAWWARRRCRLLAAKLTEGPIRAIFDGISAAPSNRLAARLECCERLMALADAERKARSIEAELRDLPAEGLLRRRLDERHSEIRTETRRLLELVAASAGAGLDPQLRERLAALRAGFENHGASLEDDDPFRREVNKAFASAMPELLKHYPLWAVSNLSVSKAVPPTPGVFDLVVIDEASQCDLASVVPVLYRSRRVMVVGDPMQLPHVTQLSREADLHARRRLGLEAFDFEPWSFRANSLFDLASSRAAAKRIELRSHYRCHPAIADYCNTGFYNKTLWVRTSEETLRHKLATANGKHGCVWTNVPGQVQSAARGCIAPAQVDAILTELRELQDAEFPGTVGVVTPFRAQADRIRDAAYAGLDRGRLEAWSFLVSTADGFQGDERDLMLFSLVGGPSMPEGSRRFLASSPNRFNVAASRARAVLHVIGDESWAETSGIPFVEELLRRCRAVDQGRVVREDLIGPVWEPRFADALREAGLPVEQQYPAGGFYLDIALLREGLRLDVEVDGEQYHRDPDSGHRRIDDVYRDTVLGALGWTVLRFWVYELREDFDGCVRRVCDTFRETG
jgi:very-short-patch-repair endonuclease